MGRRDKNQERHESGGCEVERIMLLNPLKVIGSDMSKCDDVFKVNCEALRGEL